MGGGGQRAAHRSRAGLGALGRRAGGLGQQRLAGARAPQRHVGAAPSPMQRRACVAAGLAGAAAASGVAARLPDDPDMTPFEPTRRASMAMRVAAAGALPHRRQPAAGQRAGQGPCVTPRGSSALAAAAAPPAPVTVGYRAACTVCYPNLYPTIYPIPRRAGLPLAGGGRAVGGRVRRAAVPGHGGRGC